MAVETESLIEEIIDLFDNSFAPNELIMDWASREEKVLTPKGPLALPKPVRVVALTCLERLVWTNVVPQKLWFDAALLLDAFYCQASADYSVVEDVPASCMAIVNILLKVDCGDWCNKSASLPDVAIPLVRCLRDLGYRPSDVTKEQIEKQEQVVLMGLRWQINLPSIDAWLVAYCRRLNVLTRNSFVPVFTWAWDRIMLCARAAVMRMPACHPFLPRHLAIGIVCLVLGQKRLLRVEALLPNLSKEDWEAFACQGRNPLVRAPAAQQEQYHGQLESHQDEQPDVPQPFLPDRVIELLKVATCCDLKDLQVACRTAVEVLGRAIPESLTPQNRLRQDLESI